MPHPQRIRIVLPTDVLASVDGSVGLVATFGAHEGVLVQLFVPHHDT